MADQRYCLACGQPASPVRLAFLDVLQGEQGRGALPGPPGWAPGTIDMSPVGYAPVYPQQGAAGWLRRYSGVFSLLTVLLLCLVAGLLLGHWVTQSKTTPTGPQIVKIEGLSALPAAAATSTTSATPSTTKAASSSSKSTAKEEAEEAKESAKETKEERAPPPAPTKVSSSTLQKLSNSSGKKHQEEINALGTKPIETG